MFEPLLYILTGFLIASVFWFLYSKTKDTNKIDRSLLDEKESLITDRDLLIENREGKINSLNKEIELIKDAKKELETTISVERGKAKEQLQTLNNVEKWRVNSETNVKKYEEYVNDTKNFIDKLTGNVKYQGDFGEKLLIKLLEIHGLTINTDFTVQEGSKVFDSVDDEMLKSVRPDTIMNLGKNTHVVVDSKVSLVDWKNFVNEKNDEKLRLDHLKKHKNAIDKHITTLSKKNYQKILGKNIFPSVILFIPFEPAYLAAIEKDTEIMDKAYKQNVILACPGSLLPIIKIIETIKSKDKQEANIKDITGAATKLIDRFVIMKKQLKIVIKTHRDHSIGLQKVVDNGWGGKSSLEKMLNRFKDRHGLNEANDIPASDLEDDQFISVDDPEDKSSVN